MVDKVLIIIYIVSVFIVLWGVLMFEYVVVLFGLMIGFIGLVVNIYFKCRED